MERNLLKAEMHWQALVERLLKAIQSFSKMSAKRCRNASGMLENFTFHGLVLKVLYPVRQAQRWEGEKQRLSTVSRVVAKWATFPWSLAVDQREKTGFTQWHSVTVAGRGYVGPFGAFWAPMRDHKWWIYIMVWSQTVKIPDKGLTLFTPLQSKHERNIGRSWHKSQWFLIWNLGASMLKCQFHGCYPSTLVASRSNAGYGAVAVGRVVLGLIELHGGNGIYTHRITYC